MRSPFRQRIARRLGQLALGLLVLSALVLTALRLGLPQLDQRVGWLEGVVHGATGLPVRIERVEARLAGLTPALDLHGVTLGEGGRQMRLTALRLRVDTLGSLLGGELRLARLVLEGGHVRISRRPDGRVLVQGREESLLQRMPFPGVLQVKDFDVALREGPPRARPIRLAGVSLTARHRGGSPRVDGRAGLPDLGTRLAFSATLAKTPREGALREGSAYLRIDDLPLAPLQARLASVPVRRPVSGLLNGSVWVDWREGAVTDVRVDGAVANAALGPLALERFAGHGRWTPTPGGWRVDLAQRARGPAGYAAPPTTLSLARDGEHWRLGLSELSLAALIQGVRDAGVLPAPVQSALAGREPRGRIASLGAGWRSGGADRGWRVRAELSDLAVSAAGGYPGVDGVDARLTADAHGGRFSLTSRDGAVRWPGVFREPFPLGQSDAGGGWRRTSDGLWSLHLPRVDWRAATGTAVAGLDLWLPPGGPAVLDLRVDVADLAIDAIPSRLPADRLPPEVLDWLDRALAGGRVSDGNVRLRGPLPAFPFRGGEGVFIVNAPFSGAPLRYDPQWPALSALSGDVRLTGTRLAVSVDGGRAGDVDLTRGSARIASFDSAPLRVDVSGRGPPNAMLDYLRASPLGVPGFTDTVALEGTPELRLDLGLPLRGGPATVDGAVVLDGLAVTHRGSGASARALSGTVRFNRDGLTWDGITGRLAGGALLSRGWTEGEGEGARIRSVTRFTAGAELIAPWAGELAGPLSGTSDWLLTTDTGGFRDPGAPWQAELSSDLRGLAIDAPPPLGKAANRARGLRATLTGNRAETAPLRVTYGEALGVAAGPWAGFDRIGVHLGGGRAPRPERPGVTLTGELDYLDAERLRRYAGFLGDRAGNGGPGLSSARVTVAEAALGAYRLEQVDVGVTPDAGAWRLTLDGPSVAGSVTLTPGDPPAVSAELDRLELTRAGDAGAGETPTTLPEPLPSLEVEIGALSLDGRDLGQLRLVAEEATDGPRLDQLVLNNEAMRLDASGRWRREPGRASLEGTIETVDAGDALARFGLPDALTGGTGRVTASLAWGGGPLSLDRSTLDGRLSVTLRDGAIPAVEPGAGRVVGLFSLSLLPRRLMLDFSDVFGEGLPFDVAEADFALENGIARPETFRMAGPVANVTVSGPVDLAGRTYDQVITVVPQVSSTLPLIGGLAGGPQAAMLLWLGQKLLEPGMNRLTRLRYRLTGPWEAPQLERVAPPDPGTVPTDRGNR